MKISEVKKHRRGMAFGVVLMILLVFGALMGMMLKSGREKIERAKLNSQFSGTELQANSNYDLVIRAAYAAAARAIRDYQVSGTRVSFADSGRAGGASEFMRASQELRRVEGSNWEYRLNCMPNPVTCNAADLDCPNWANICDSGDRLPLRFNLSVSQRDPESSDFYAQVSGSFEIGQGDLNQFSSLFYGLKNDPIVLGAGEHQGSLGLFFAAGPSNSNENNCRVSTGGSLQSRTINLLPARGQRLEVNAIATNARAQDVCYGIAADHRWGAFWGTGMLNNYGSVINHQGFIFTGNPVSDLRAHISQQFNSIFGSQYLMFNRFVQDWQYAEKKMRSQKGIAALSLEGMSDIKRSLISREWNTTMEGGSGDDMQGSGSYAVNFSEGSYSEVGGGGEPSSSTGNNGTNVAVFDPRSSVPISATLEFRNNGDGTSSYNLTESFSGGEPDFSTGFQLITNDTAIATRALVTRAFTPGADYTAVTNSNFSFYTEGSIEITQPFITHTYGVHDPSPSAQNSWTFASLQGTPANIPADAQSLLTGHTLLDIRNNQSLISANPMQATFRLDLSLISVAPPGANGLTGKPYLALAPELLDATGLTVATARTIGGMQLSGQSISAAMAQMRAFDSTYENVIAGFKDVHTSYPPGAQANRRFSIMSNTLPTVREIARSSRYVNMNEALTAALRDLNESP